jgi:hypothetical protein
MPVFLLMFMCFVRFNQNKSIGDGLGFFFYVVLPCLCCGIPGAIFFVTPALAYLAMAYTADWIKAHTGPWGMVRKLGTNVWLRRILWFPVAGAYWALLIYILPITPLVTALVIVSGLTIVLGFGLWLRYHQRLRLNALRSLLLADGPVAAHDPATYS